MGRSRSAASPTTGDRPLPRPGAIATSASSASAPTAATWRPPIIPDAGLTVWDVDRRVVSPRRPGPRVVGHAARFSPDSRRIAVAHEDGEIVVYDLATGRPGRRWPGRAGSRPGLPSRRGPDRGHFDDERRPPHLPDPGDGDGPARPDDPPARVSAADVAWSPDGTTLATPGERSQDLPLGRRHGTPAGDPRGPCQWRRAAGVPPAGTLLASNGWEERLRLWDPILGRRLAERDRADSDDRHFSRDGRIVVSLGDSLTTYQVEPALEYRTLAHASRRADRLLRSRRSATTVGCWPSGTNRGVVLWDLARGTELAFLPIGIRLAPRCSRRRATCSPAGRSACSGGRSGSTPERGEFRIGPPHRLPLAGGH